MAGLVSTGMRDRSPLSRAGTGPVGPLLVAGLLGLMLLLLGPAAALAKGTPNPQSGVHLDPGSPASKQYAVPLSVARGGGGGSGSGSSSSGGLFGAGISQQSSPTTGATATTVSPATSAPTASVTTPATTSTSTPAAKTRHRHKHRSVAAAPRPKPRVTKPAAVTTPSPVKVLHPSGGSGVAWMLGLAAVVVLLGLAGTVLVIGRDRRRLPRPIKRST
jgi:hypothetical protein